jgi:hypothetical protein
MIFHIEERQMKSEREGNYLLKKENINMKVHSEEN